MLILSISSVHKCDIKSDHAALMITEFLFCFKQDLLFSMVVGNYWGIYFYFFYFIFFVKKINH